MVSSWHQIAQLKPKLEGLTTDFIRQLGDDEIYLANSAPIMQSF